MPAIIFIVQIIENKTMILNFLINHSVSMIFVRRLRLRKQVTHSRHFRYLSEIQPAWSTGTKFSVDMHDFTCFLLALPVYTKLMTRRM